MTKSILSARVNSNYSHEYVARTMEKAAANSSSQNRIGENNQADKRDLNPTSQYNEAPVMQQQAQFMCSLYISRADGLQDQVHGVKGDVQYLSHCKDKNYILRSNL